MGDFVHINVLNVLFGQPQILRFGLIVKFNPAGRYLRFVSGSDYFNPSALVRTLKYFSRGARKGFSRNMVRRSVDGSDNEVMPERQVRVFLLVGPTLVLKLIRKMSDSEEVWVWLMQARAIREEVDHFECSAHRVRRRDPNREFGAPQGSARAKSDKSKLEAV